MTGIVIYGMVNSAFFILIALGFSLTFGISGMANFAHGAFYITGAYILWLLLNMLGMPYLIAVFLAIILSGLIGAILYWVVIYRIRGIVLAEVVATFGFGVGILELFRSIGLSGHSYKLPSFVDGSLSIMGVYVDYHRILLIAISGTLVACVWILSHKTKMGLAFRALAQNEQTALAFGIESDRTAMWSLAVGCSLSAAAAIIIMPLSVILVEEGNHILVLALAVGIVGGMESIIGIIVAGLIFGYAQIIVSTLFTPHYSMIVLLGAILVVLGIKPSGLFGKFKELEERV